MERSLKIYAATEIIMDFWLGYFLSIVYFHAISMTDFHISIFQAIIAVCMFGLDIPTGIFADRTGARKSIILGYGALSLAFFAYVVAYFVGYWVAIFIASFLFALSDGLRSGASQAYVFTLHKQLAKESEYVSYMSKLGFWTNLSTATAAVLGGYLYQIHPTIPYSIQGVFMLIATILSLGLREVHVPSAHMVNLRSQYQGIISILKRTKTTILLIALLVTSLVTYEIFNNLTNQSYWKEVGIPVTYFGYIGLSIFVIRAFMVRATPWICDRLGRFAWSFIGACVIIICTGFYFTRSFAMVAILSWLLSGLSAIVRRIADQSFQEAIHIESVRATFLSFANTVSNFVIRGFFFLAAFLLMNYSYGETLLVFWLGFWGLTILFGFGYAVLLAHRSRSIVEV